ncbi:MAG: hypothetical protein JWP81_4887 [Ferruginibacter sp.]|nr:hypothetical protein [Ferruginibacter sp.]
MKNTINSNVQSVIINIILVKRDCRVSVLKIFTFICCGLLTTCRESKKEERKA